MSYEHYALVYTTKRCAICEALSHYLQSSFLYPSIGLMRI